MEKNKKIWLISVIVLAIAILLVIFFAAPESRAPYVEIPNDDEITLIEYTTEDRELFDNFLRENISAISPEAEVLGGTFYVTEIDWENEREGIVAYEDGHIALRASFGFSFPNANKDEIQLDYFDIIPLE